MTSPEQITSWVDNYSPTGGDILLLHDNRPTVCHAIRQMASNGLFEQIEAVTVSHWLPANAKGVKHANHR